MAKTTPEQDTVRLQQDEKTVEEKAFDYSKYFVGQERDKEPEDDGPPRRAKSTQERRAEEMEDKAHREELNAQAAEFAQLIFIAGAQATDRLTPDMPYKYDEALAMSKALVNFADKYSDGVIGDWKEEIALVMVSLSQIVPRYAMWKAKQPVDLNTLSNTTVPK